MHLLVALVPPGDPDLSMRTSDWYIVPFLPPLTQLVCRRGPVRCCRRSVVYMARDGAQGFGFRVLGCAAQRWDANSLSRWRAKFSFISCREAPNGGPVGVNAQPQSEQV